MDDDDHANASLRSIIDVGTSAGGARAKAVIAWNPKTDEIRSGQLEAPDGFEHWLLKFDGMGDDHELGASQNYGRVEYAYHLMARAAGIDMTDCRLLKENGRAHFMTRRFDREGMSGRNHMQTLCAMSHIDYKKKGTNAYSQLFSAMTQLNLPYEDMEKAFRRMVFNVMGRNCDDHTKNFSFLLREGSATPGLRRHLRSQSHGRMDQPAPDVSERKVQGFRSRRPAGGGGPVQSWHCEQRHRAGARSHPAVAAIRDGRPSEAAVAARLTQEKVRLTAWPFR